MPGKYQYPPLLLGTALLTALLITGCDKPASEIKNVANPTQQAADKALTPQEQWFEKVSAYVAISNGLRSDAASTIDFIQKMRAEEAAKAEAGDFKKIRTNYHLYDERFVRKMEEALAMPASTPELDAAAKKLLATTKQFVPQWKALGDYNTAKKYEDDQGAKGREMLKTYLQGIHTLDADTSAFSDAVRVAAKQSHDKRLAIYRKEGMELEASTMEALGNAQQVLEIFSEDDDLQNKTKIDQANTLIEQMEKNIESIRAEHTKRKEKKERMPTMDNYISITDDLQRLAGAYRESRKSPERFNDVVRYYNGAVQNYNRMH